MVEQYPRPGGDVNSRENRARRSHRGKKPRRAGQKTIDSRSPLITKYSTICPALLGLRQGDLGKNMGRRRLRRHERQFQVIDDAIHHGILREKGDDLHPASAFRAGHGVDFVHLPDHLGPALGGETAELVDIDEREVVFVTEGKAAQTLEALAGQIVSTRMLF